MAFGDVIQTKTAIALTAVANISLTLDSTPVEGNMLVAIAGGRAVATIDTPSGWTEGVTLSGSNLRNKISFKEAGASESTSVQFDWASPTTDQMVLIVVEFEGPFDGTPLDVSASTSSGSSAVETLTSGTTATTAQADELAVAGLVCRSEISAPSWDASFATTASELGGTGTNDAEAVMGNLVLSSTQAVQTDASWTTGVRSTAAVITLKKAAAAAVLGGGWGMIPIGG